MWLSVHEMLRERILPIRMMIFDVDGVLTDGRIIYHDDGSEIKAFNSQDGHGIKLLQRSGVEVALITGRYCKAVEHRASSLGITKVYQDARIKLEPYQMLLKETGLRDEQVGYAGDDLIDIPVMRRAGFAVAVPNAVSQVFPYAHYVTKAPGGAGAAREVCDLLLQVQGHWERITERYFGDFDN
jgi:3-deoxy-D-manno-octulosonate 8-phosphate phosphatase (KDO 8-P phosphatase)